jgi:hypothetical protein
MRRYPTAPVNVARISVATSGIDFTAPEADFAALIRAAGFCPGRSHCHVGAAGVGQRLVRFWRKAAVHKQTASRDLYPRDL